MTMTSVQTTTPAAGPTGCGGASCQCGGTTSAAQPATSTPPSINGIYLFAPGQPDPALDMREVAYAELLRQEAVRQGLLPMSRSLVAPELSDADRQVLEAMVDAAVAVPEPTPAECQRYYEANAAQYVVGQALHLRHILFAVTPGVPVQALATHAEKALLELLHKDAAPGRFEALAAELSNCPTSQQGGDLGWVEPQDCAPELARALFHDAHAQRSTGVHTALVHSRFGFHIVEILARREGQQKQYTDVQDRIAAQLSLQTRSKAMHQYMSLLVGAAQVEGIELEGADSPLLQ